MEPSGSAVRLADRLIDLRGRDLLRAEEPVHARDTLLLAVHAVLGHTTRASRGDDHRITGAPVGRGVKMQWRLRNGILAVWDKVAFIG